MRTIIGIGLAVCVFLSATSTALAQKPDFSGNWVLNENLSQDPLEKIYMALGTDQLRGSGTGVYNSVSSGTLLRDADRANTLRTLVDFAEVIDVLEIEQSDEELKVGVGEGNEFFSLFYLDGEPHARQLPDGLRLQARAEWRGDSIHVMQVGENDARLQQVYSRHGEDQLAFVFQLDSKLSDAPVQFRLVYDRTERE